MTRPDHPAPPPPEVPAEFAAAYREAYERALASARGMHAEPASDGQVADRPSSRFTDIAAVLGTWRESRWFLPAAATATAVVLIGAAYAVGTTFSGDGQPGAGETAVPQASRTSGKAHAGPSRPTKSVTVSAPGGWQGPVQDVHVDAIAADCTAPPGTDSAGHRVTYVPENAVDGKADTAWRCPGSGVGQKLTLRLSDDADIAEVGLVPGYAKTDAASGADRYAENDRVTKVRWTFGDGESVVQRLDPDPALRAMQLVRVPRTTTDTVTLEILALKRGPRDTTAISEIQLAAAR